MASKKSKWIRFEDCQPDPNVYPYIDVVPIFDDNLHECVAVETAARITHSYMWRPTEKLGWKYPDEAMRSGEYDRDGYYDVVLGDGALYYRERLSTFNFTPDQGVIPVVAYRSNDVETALTDIVDQIIERL